MSEVGGWVLYILYKQVEDKRIWDACIFTYYLFIACIRSKNKPILHCSYYTPILLLYLSSLRGFNLCEHMHVVL